MVKVRVKNKDLDHCLLVKFYCPKCGSVDWFEIKSYPPGYCFNCQARLPLVDKLIRKTEQLYKIAWHRHRGRNV
jgi:hypothetical protein